MAVLYLLGWDNQNKVEDDVHLVPVLVLHDTIGSSERQETEDSRNKDDSTRKLTQ